MNQAAIELELPIRWADMDALGHVNNTVYFTFCESARIAYFGAVELASFSEKETDGPGLVAANLNFRRQMKYPGTIRVRAKASRIGKKSFNLDYEIRDVADGEVVADGSSVCVWVDYAESKAKLLPQALVKAIQLIEQNPNLGCEN
jgi:acyl-CoA thioester hydrolase